MRIALLEGLGIVFHTVCAFTELRFTMSMIQGILVYGGMVSFSMIVAAVRLDVF